MIVSLRNNLLAFSLIAVTFFTSIVNEHEQATHFCYQMDVHSTTIELVLSNPINRTSILAPQEICYHQNNHVNPNQPFKPPQFTMYPTRYLPKIVNLPYDSLLASYPIISVLRLKNICHQASDDDSFVC
jgi:hypothetical protein